jgi:PAS domain S-box-containing protein
MLKQSKKSIPEVTFDYSALRLKTDPAGIILSASADLLSFTGKHQEELIGSSFKKIIDAADKPKLQAVLNTGINSGLTVQLAIKGKSGVHQIGFTATYQQSSPEINDVIAWNAVPELKPATISIANNSLLEKFFHFSNDLLCLMDEEGFIKKVNNSLSALLRYSPEEMHGRPFIHFIHPDERSSFNNSWSLPINENNKAAIENRYCCKDGQVKTISWSTSWLEEEKLTLAIGQEIAAKQPVDHASALMETRQELKEITARYKAFVQQSSEIIWRCELQTPVNITDPEEEQLQQLFEGYLAECNDQMAHFYGYENAADAIGKKVSVFFDPNEPVTYQVVREFIQQGYKIYRRLSMHIDHQGNKRYFLNNLVGVVEEGKLLRVWTTQNEITQLRSSQQQLKEYSERITNILASITDGFIAVDKSLNIFLWNHAVEHITGLKAKNVIGSGVEKVFPNFIGTTEYKQYIEAINKDNSSNFEHFLPAFNRWLETSVYPFSQGAFIYFRDITDRKNQERLLELEKQVLEINAQPAASLKTTIDYFLTGLEKTFSQMIASVIMLNDDRQTIMHLSGPSLPDEFSRAINGLKIGPYVASCGTAIYRKEKVITVDIDTDPLWDKYREFAKRFGLRSCWSFPILNANNDVLATIAVYHRFPATPTESELSLFERVVTLLRIIIENKNAELKIRLTNERYLLVTKATNDAIWDWDVHTNTLYWGEGIYTLFGFKPGYVDNSSNFWENCIHPDDRDRVVNGLNRFIKESTSKIWEDEYRFIKPNGEYALVFDRGFLIYDHSGKIARMVGSMQDVTDKKELEKKLFKQEVDKQKLVAQAVVDAQEKERAEIGKELHDNVNQILSTAKLYLELAYTDDKSRLELINRSTNNISDAINEIRTISRSLVPPSIGDLGLIDSVQDLVENVKATRRLHVEFYYSGIIDDILDEKRKLMLFRIIQEQVNNVLKHASANNLVIEMIADSEGHAVDLTISDDGKGFELDKVRLKKGVGLSNIASRAQLFNGSVHIVTALGEGCKLKINVPISNI